MLQSGIRVECATALRHDGLLLLLTVLLTLQLLTCLEGLINEEHERKWMPLEDAGTQVLGSANQLFLKIRSSLTRCVKLVSKGPTLLGMVGAFRKVGQMLQSRISCFWGWKAPI